MFGYLVLFTALSLAGVAAWFAIYGIMAFFAGADVITLFGLSISLAMIMGIVIELGKVVGVSWIYRNWSDPTTHLPKVLIPFVAVAMLLTSAGIFGFLSKAHIEQNAPVVNNELRIERLDKQIERELAKITDAEEVIAQLDGAVRKLIEYDKISGPDGSRAVRAGQQDQRDMYAIIITEAQTKIDEYEDKKLELNQELTAVELELGPIKYVAALIYEDAETNTEEAARILILAFIFVFDPMAILLLMAANHTILREGNKPDDLQKEFEDLITPKDPEPPAPKKDSPPKEKPKPKSKPKSEPPAPPKTEEPKSLSEQTKEFVNGKSPDFRDMHDINGLVARPVKPDQVQPSPNKTYSRKPTK